MKAGGGYVMYLGDMVRDFLMKLDWFGALFPRIPVPIQKVIVANMKEYGPSIKEQYQEEATKAEQEKLVFSNIAIIFMYFLYTVMEEVLG